MTRERFDEIIHLQYRKLYMIAVRILKNRQEAEDTVQEVFMKMWTMGEKLDEYNDAGAIAVTMLKNKCIDIVRRRKFDVSGEVSTAVLNIEGPKTPLDQMVSGEARNLIIKIISLLPQKYRELVQQREIDGLSYEEISTLTGVNVNSLRVSISRARQIIKEEYLKYTYERGTSENITRKVL